MIEWKTTILHGFRLRKGGRVLDLGCGSGDDASDIGAIVGPEGHVTGVDIGESLIAEAIRRSSVQNLSVSFEVGDARALRFADESFDAVRTERVLMHVPDPVKALAEMVRVLKPGGRMAVQDIDWETQFCDSPHKEITRKIALSFCDGIKNGWIGRCLPRLFREAGMTDVTVSFSTLNITYDFLQLLVGGARCTGSLQWSTFGKGGGPLVDASHSCERRGHVPVWIHSLCRFRRQAPWSPSLAQ